MRGYHEVGQLKNICAVEPHAGGFRGRLSVAGHGTWLTEVYPTEGSARIELCRLEEERAPGVFTKQATEGVSVAQQQDFSAAIHNKFAAA